MKPVFTSFILLLTACVLNAQTTEVVPQGFAGTAGGASFTGPFASTARSYQLVIDASQLTNLQGQQITGFTFRSPASASTTWPASSFSYTDYDVYMGPAVQISSGTTTFTTNESGPQTQVRSGALSFNAGDFPTGGVSSWGPVIMLSSPYLYTGGNLCLLIRHSAAGTNRAIDAVGTSNSGYGTLFRAAWGSGITSTGGMQGNFGVTQLTYITPLSLTLTGFSAGKQGDAAVLRWMAEDAAVSHFTIERSFDGAGFKDLGIVYPGTHRNGDYYEFRDEQLKQAPAAEVFYRLRILEQNGELSYSQVVKLRLDQSSLMVLAPNPAADLMNVRFDARGGERGQYRITDISGRRVLEGTKDCVTGVNELQLDLAQLPAGMYSFWLHLRGETRTRQFVKR